MNRPALQSDFDILVKDVAELSERVKALSRVLLRMTKKAPKKRRSSKAS